ncbi:MAG: hypothetical protein NTX50_28180 [Candidatus Sumerlaeota bacterium]|nr:hypothetical protein [Candidatus Sumerlaeota bacterium]
MNRKPKTGNWKPAARRRGVALLITLGILAVMFLVMFAIIGGQAGNGAQTVNAQAQAVALSEERSAILRALSRWVSDGRQDSEEMYISVLSDWLRKTAGGGKAAEAADNPKTVYIVIKTATAPDAEYAKSGLIHKPKDIWIEANTPVTAQGLTRRAVYLCREGDFERRALVREEYLMKNP